MISPGSGMPRLSSPMTSPTSAYTATAGTVSSHSWTCNATPPGPLGLRSSPQFRACARAGRTVGKPTGSGDGARAGPNAPPGGPARGGPPAPHAARVKPPDRYGPYGPYGAGGAR
ncbi:hypothetical protein GCM10010340_00810 [Streptomyces griseoloalbus]|nr:hypothetical protein GCM10010340_00810 [Streptomyces albaduncus]